jgi:AcrR family transcriptional regulator
MRRLAARLGVSTMSTYHHVADKAALVEAIADRVMGRLEVPEESVPWEEAVRTMSWSFRSLTQRHPAVFRVLLGQERPAALLRTAETVIARLVAAGFSDTDALTTFRVFVRFLLGSVMVEATPRLPLAELDDTFQRGLELLIAGVAAQRATSS